MSQFHQPASVQAGVGVCGVGYIILYGIAVSSTERQVFGSVPGIIGALAGADLTAHFSIWRMFVYSGEAGGSAANAR